MTASTADTITFSLVGFVVVVAVVVIWRVLGHDHTVRRVRFGVFYERERDGDEPEDE